LRFPELLVVFFLLMMISFLHITFHSRSSKPLSLMCPPLAGVL
jgi:hypothetical protein